MKKLVTLLLAILTWASMEAQIATNIYWVQFTDKNNSPYSIDVPEEFLSQRALDRRARLGIAIDEYDLPVNPQYLEAVAGCGAELINPSKWLNGVTVYTADPAVVAAINALGCVQTVRHCPNDPVAQQAKEAWLAQEMKQGEALRGPYDYYGGGNTQIHQLNGHVLHDQGYMGEGMVVAVLDGGFEGADTHPCFDNMREEGRLLGTRSMLRGHPSVYTMHNHGTSCLSTMAALVPTTLVGTAPKASYYLIHTETSEYESIVEEYNWVSGAEYADSVGVDLCSTSLGYIGFDMEQWSHPFEHFDGQTAPITIGAEIAVSRGVVCLIAAGNEGYPWNPGCTLSVPADAEHVLTIGSVDSNGNRSIFSSTGPTYDGRIKPDVMAMGSDAYVASGTGGYYNGSGTSFATPIIAGVVTCLRQAHPHASVQELCDIIRQCGNRANNPDNYYGYGVPDFAQVMELLHVEDTFAPKKELIMVYPNPSQGEVHIAMKEGYQAELSVFDITGRQLGGYHFNGLNHTTFEHFLNGLPGGIYVIKATSELGSQVVKLVLTR